MVVALSNELDIEVLKDPLKYIPAYLRVLSKADKNGVSHLVPMQLWPAQEDYIRNRTHRDVVLKARQMGLSTGVMAANSHLCFTVPYSRMAIITHNQDTSEFLLQTVSRFHRNLPLGLKPKVDWHSGSRIRFPVLDSLIHIDSAESSSIGFGESLNIVHLSEMSRWPNRTANELYAGITQTVPEGGFITIESTPRGRGGLFYNLYQASKKGDTPYKTFFYPWWFDPFYVRQFDRKLELTKEEQLLINLYHLTDGQIAFRREKITELGDLFYQEYPENDIDCWLINESGVFDPGSIRRNLLQVREGRQEGDLTTWKDVVGGDKYVIGVDVAAGVAKGDYSVAAVINIRRNEYVSRIRGRIHPDLFAEQVLRLGYRYNNALIGVERTGHGLTVLRTLVENNYPELYYHQDLDKMTGEPATEPGWKTNVGTKPTMVNTLVVVLRAGDLMVWSENFLNEASSYIWEGTRATKSSGAFDDELDAVMIALQLREQAPLQDSARSRPASYVTLW